MHYTQFISNNIDVEKWCIRPLTLNDRDKLYLLAKNMR